MDPLEEGGCESWEELAADMGLSVEALLAQVFSVCPRKGVVAVDEQGKPIPCDVCGLCDDELPF